MFSKACEYGIRAATFIAQQSLQGKRVNVVEIAEEIESPAAFTAKILQMLVRAQLIDSVKGAGGGFQITREQAERIKLRDIVCAIDGSTFSRECVLGLNECSAAKPCPVHDKFVTIRDELNAMLTATSLAEMTLGLSRGATYLRR